MSRIQILALAAAVSLAVASPELAAAKPPHAGPKTPKVTAGPKVKASTKAPKVNGPKAPKVNGPKVAAGSKAPKAQSGPKGPKAPKAGKAVPPGHAKRAGGAPATPAGGKMKGGNAGKSRVGTDGSTLPPAMPKNEKLVARLQALLPAGMTVEQAAEGFRNQGQFMAAVRVSNNLGIPFADLKTSMVTDGRSLGQSIQTLRPGIDADAETTRATRWANQQIETAEPLEPR
jgi:hypothetical protein